MSKKLLYLTIFAVMVMAAPIRADLLSGLADVAVEDGAIISLRYALTDYIVADGDLVLGITTRWYIPADTGVPTLWVEGDPAPEATVSGTSSPKEGDVGSNADNFFFSIEGDADNISSIDGIDYQETIFAEPSNIFFVFERGGNDAGTIQAILEDGSLGEPVAFDKGTNGGPYTDTGIANGNQNAWGVVFKTDVPAIGVRIAASGHDTLSISTQAPPPKPKVAWVSYHAADDEPHADAAAVGFTQAPDIEYTDLLTAQGYNVVRVLTSQTPDVEYLNTMDLVIISRTASSGHYSGSGATLWNIITAPMINLNGYTLRSSRLGFTDGTDMPDTTGDVRLTVTDPTHPIFAGIALTDGTMDNLYAEGAVPLPTDGVTLSRGISINNNNIDDEGTVLATIAEASADTGPVGGMVIAELPAGATMENSSGSPTDVLGGPRLVFLTGSREPDGVTGGQAAALYDLYPDGEQMFLNAVKYMIPVVPVDPGTDGLVAYYALENDANDSSGNGLDGIIIGDPNFVEGAVGMGLQLDGVDDYVDLGNDPLFDMTEQVTLSLWVNTQDIGNTENNPWLGKSDTSYMIKGHREGNQIEFFIYDGGWVTAHADVGAEFNGEWHHAAGVFDGEQLIIYVDGEEAVSVDYEGVGIVPNTYNVAIGTNTQANGRFSESILDEAMIYNRALSAGEISYLAGERAPYIYDGDVLDDSWDHDNNSDAWDGTGPGEGSPGGAGLLVEDDVTFLRVQDTGDPRGDGFSDPSNRKVYLTKQIDFGLDGSRLEFQLRVATTPPLDNQAGGESWPEGGIGYYIRDGGKGMISIAEDGVGQISFSLAKAGEIEGLETDALVMNGLLGAEMSDDVDTGDAATPNAIPIADATAWNTVTVDIAAGGAGTHVLTVSVNGGEPVAVEVTTGASLDGDNDYIAIGSSGTGGITAFDIDYVTISQTPVVDDAPPLVGDEKVVDDFEQYTEVYPIWNVWADGYFDDNNGSVVGTEFAPGTEQGAMPLSYDNTGTAAYSEVTRTYDPPQNWSQLGFNSVVISFKGVPGNTLGQLYIRINDQDDVWYGGPDADLQNGFWHTFNVGFDLSSVQTLTIGVKSGGKGVLYIDNIELGNL